MKSWIVSNLGVCLLIMRFINMKGLNWSQELTHEMVKEVFASKLWKIHLLININHTHRSILKRVNHIENLPHEVQCKLMKLRERWKMERSRWEFGMWIISISQSMALKFDRFKRRYYIFVFNPMVSNDCIRQIWVYPNSRDDSMFERRSLSAHKK